jgi:hypothetical protein
VSLIELILTCLTRSLQRKKQLGVMPSSRSSSSCRSGTLESLSVYQIHLQSSGNRFHIYLYKNPRSLMRPSVFFCWPVFSAHALSCVKGIFAGLENKTQKSNPPHPVRIFMAVPALVDILHTACAGMPCICSSEWACRIHNKSIDVVV